MMIDSICKLLNNAYSKEYGITVERDDVCIYYLFSKNDGTGFFTVAVPKFHFRIAKERELLAIVMISTQYINRRINNVSASDEKDIVRFIKERFKLRKPVAEDLLSLIKHAGVYNCCFKTVEGGKFVNHKLDLF